MKLRVVGWTYYESSMFKEGESNWVARMALVDEIRKNGYLFSGYAHQECYNCEPVFNDGKIRRFSQRGFADIMAEANGDNDYMAYSLYMFGLNSAKCKYPERGIYKGDFEAEKDLAETFVVEVDEQTFATAPTLTHPDIGGYINTAKTIKVIKLPDLPEYRYIGEGDTLVLTCKGKYSAFSIVEVNRNKGLSPKELDKYIKKMSPYHNPKGYEKVRKKIYGIASLYLFGS